MQRLLIKHCQLAWICKAGDSHAQSTVILVCGIFSLPGDHGAISSGVLESAHTVLWDLRVILSRILQTGQRHIGRLKITLMKVFTPWKLAKATNHDVTSQQMPQPQPAIKIYEHTAWVDGEKECVMMSLSRQNSPKLPFLLLNKLLVSLCFKPWLVKAAWWTSSSIPRGVPPQTQGTRSCVLTGSPGDIYEQ